MKGFERERIPIGDNVGLNESFTDLPSTQPKRRYPTFKIRAFTASSGKALWI